MSIAEANNAPACLRTNPTNTQLSANTVGLDHYTTNPKHRAKEKNGIRVTKPYFRIPEQLKKSELLAGGGREKIHGRAGTHNGHLMA